jgi:hypothetical protein
MRTRTRIHPYVLPEISKRLAAYCGAKGLSESAAVEAAVSQYLDGREKDNDLILRRLDRLTREFGRQRRDLEVLSEAFAMYVLYWFKYVPERSHAEEQAAESLSLRRFDKFIEWVSVRMGRNARLASEVLKGDGSASPDSRSAKPGPSSGGAR